MGMMVSDSLQLEDIARACDEIQRWEFMVTIGSLRIVGGTGAPFNPIVVRGHAVRHERRRHDGRGRARHGGGTGIGAATAKLLARKGLQVVIVGRRAELLAEVAGSSSAITAIPADLGEADAPHRIVAEVTDRLGRLDVLVNCAAVIRNHPVAEYTLAEIDQHLDVNIRAPFLLTQASLPALTAAPYGSIVNISSSSGTILRSGQSLYGLTKAALEYFTRSMAGELAPVGIRVNGIAPGRSTRRFTRRGPMTWRRPIAGWRPRCRWAGSGSPTRSPTGSGCWRAPWHRLSPAW